MAALVAFRVAFGLLITVSAIRFLAYGWVDELFVRQQVRFHYWGFGWVPTMPVEWMKPAFAALVVLGLMVSAGVLYRFAMAALLVFFAWLQLVDVTNYLNHYYLVALLAALMLVMPLGRAASVDAWLWPRRRVETFPAWCTRLLQFQVGTVYFFAGLAKLNSDWLLHAQPLNIWLSARTSMPLVGPLLDERWVAYLAAWFGFIFDTTAPLFLSLKRTRRYFYVLVLGFHAATWALFPIGMFPFIMVTAALVFFDASWPRRFLRSRPPELDARPVHVPRWAPALAVAIACWCAVQALLPLRAHLYGPDVSWHEQGMRFSWRVMSREKNGSVTFFVKDKASGREWVVSPERYLTQLQEREMSTQPDLIWQFARVLQREWAGRGFHDVEIRADALASWNGRPAARLIDPKVDLLSVEDGLQPKPWILPSPGGEPIHLKPLASR